KTTSSSRSCFFQAEDGIRDATVTGVQTCALPILNRVYVRTPSGPLRMEPWLQGLRKGHSFATNGPLIDFALGGKSMGDELNLPEGRHELQFTAWLRSIVPVDHLEILCNGQVVKSLPVSGSRHSADARGTLPIEKSG